MKKIIIASSCLFLLLFSACFELISPDDSSPDLLPEDQFVVGIDSLRLSANELATIPGRNPVLNAIYYPVFATENNLKWTSSNTDAATVNESTGLLSVRTDEVTDDPLITVIRVEAIEDPSKYDICVLTVYPNYDKTRIWTWSADPGSTGDLDQGSGGILLFGSGNCLGYNPGDNGEGVYVIDPDAPYEFGVDTPNGAARPSGTFSTSNNNFTGNRSGQFVYPATYNYSHHIRSSGSAARVMKIAALFTPFTVVVNYQSNDAGVRNADIRIGDKEGLRIEGPASTNNNTSGARSVWYSYDPDNPEKPEFGNENFVPLIFIEANQGLRLYAVYILEGIYELNESGKLLVPAEP